MGGRGGRNGWEVMGKKQYKNRKIKNKKKTTQTMRDKRLRVGWVGVGGARDERGGDARMLCLNAGEGGGNRKHRVLYCRI